jgi:hypothetical protein
MMGGKHIFTQPAMMTLPSSNELGDNVPGSEGRTSQLSQLGLIGEHYCIVPSLLGALPVPSPLP